MPELSAELERTTIAVGEMLPGYDLLSVIGTGGFGTVMRARQLKLDRIVAVKVVKLDQLANPALAARFQAEAITLGRFHHPNIVQVHDFVIHSARMFIAMELLEGEDLGQRLKRAGNLDERTAWAIARQTASALAHAAAQGVVHRDIKPTNLFLVPAPTGFGLRRDVPMVKVTDFGLALTKWSADSSGERHSVHGTVLGTPMYMAPEQYKEAGELDHRVDIYALGATVFHCLAGRPPFDGDTIWDVMMQKLHGAPKSWPPVSAESIALLSAMLASNPDKRIGTYDELIDRIDRLSVLRNSESFLPKAGTSNAAVIQRPPPSPHRVASRRRYGVLGAAVLLAIGIGVAFRNGWTGSPGTQLAESRIRYVSRGDHQALFDNESLAGWLPPAAGGVWRVESDDEQTTVLCGTGFTRRSFAPMDNYRVTIGLDIHKATAAEVHFALHSAAPDTAQRLVLRVSKSAGAVFGVKDGDKGEFHPLGPVIPFPSPDWFEGRRPYLELRFERVGPTWIAWFNGQKAGHAADDGVVKASELRLFADGGLARVDSVVLEQLQASAQHQ